MLILIIYLYFMMKHRYARIKECYCYFILTFSIFLFNHLIILAIRRKERRSSFQATSSNSWKVSKLNFYLFIYFILFCKIIALSLQFLFEKLFAIPINRNSWSFQNSKFYSFYLLCVILSHIDFLMTNIRWFLQFWCLKK